MVIFYRMNIYIYIYIYICCHYAEVQKHLCVGTCVLVRLNAQMHTCADRSGRAISFFRADIIRDSPA
jgi:hypothetical protein